MARTSMKGPVAGSFLRVLAWLCAAVVVVLVAGLAVVVFRYVPFALPSYAAWTSIGMAAASLPCVIRPPRTFGLHRRRGPLLVAVAAAATAVVAIVWPAPIVRASGPHQRLDDFLPEYQFSEYHEVVIEAPVERVIEAARGVSFADIPAVVWLMRTRQLAGGDLRALAPRRVAARPILDVMSRPGSGFLRLDVSNPRELVLGMVGKPWAKSPPPAVSTAEEFLAFEAAGQIRVAFNFRIDDLGHGRVRVSTETRTLGNDEEARRVFARYWHLIYPGSAIIRGLWLEAIAAKALRADARAS